MAFPHGIAGREGTPRPGSASALRWPCRNRKRASDLHGRGSVRPNGDFVSGHPQSAPDTARIGTGSVENDSKSRRR